jgi:ABC-type transporter Mla maintaining outer membrane lipid asymmetry ATPase subunit MlaF
VLDGLDLTVASGGIVGLLGPSGQRSRVSLASALLDDEDAGCVGVQLLVVAAFAVAAVARGALTLRRRTP